MEKSPRYRQKNTCPDFLLPWAKLQKRAELGYQTLIIIVLAFLLFFIILILIASSTDFMSDYVPKIFKIGR